MTDLLRHVLAEHADAIPPPHLEPSTILTRGRRAVRRRRAVVAGAAVVVVATAGLLVTALPGHDDPVVRPAAPTVDFGEQLPAYSLGDTVHVGEARFTVSQPIRALVQTDAGIVYADDDGVVHAADGVTETTVGRLDLREGRLVLVSHRSTAAWLDTSGRLVALDQASGETRSEAVSTVADADVESAAQVYAVDGDTVYARDARGAFAWDDHGIDVLQPPRSGELLRIDDVKGDVFATTVIRDGEESFHIGAKPGTGFTPEGHASATRLSPDGSRVVVEVTDGVPAVYDTQTGSRVTTPRTGYSFVAVYQWHGEDSYTAIAADDTPGDPFGYDLLTCSLTTRDCATVATDLPVGDGALIPVGMPLS